MTTIEPTEKLAVHEALAAVLADMPAIEKGGEAPQSMGGYKFRSIEDITAALKPLFAKYGVLCVPSVMERIESQRTTGNNKILWCVDLEICFRFIGPQGDELAANVWGQGTDSGDKAVQKAVTSAFKTMLGIVFCISDRELDAEAHDVPETQRQSARSAQQLTVEQHKARIDGIVDELAELKLTDWVRDQGFEWPWSPEVCDVIDEKIAMKRAEPPEPPCDADAAETPDPPAAEPPAPEDAEEAAEVAEPAVLDFEQVRAQIEAEVKATPPNRLYEALEKAGQVTTGAPKALRARLVEYRVREVQEGRASPTY